MDAAGGEGVELEDLAAGQVHADEGEAVDQKLGPQEVADALLGGAKGAAAVLETGALLLAIGEAGQSAVDCDLAADADGLATEKQDALLAVLGLGQVFLRHRVAILGDGGDDGVQVPGLAAPHVEDLLAAGVGQRLEHGLAAELAHERFELGGRARDQGARVHVGGQVREVETAPGAKHALGIIDHEGAIEAQAPAEVEDGRGWGAVRLTQGVVADEDYVEA